MRFGILGSTWARTADDDPVAIGGPRPRALLALLLLDAGRVVGTDRLIDGLYGESPPREATNALQAQVSRLRAKLGRESIELHPAGYRLAIEPDDVDVHRFTRLTGEGRDALTAGKHTAAARLLREALDLWDGPALADVGDVPFAEPQAVRLAELRLVAVEDHAEAELALGRAHAVVTELRQLGATRPLRERLHGLLIRALGDTGRQAEALAVFEGIRRGLVDEFGADPSPELAAAHLSVLRAEPLHATGVPAQLTTFVGRNEELKRVADVLTEARLVTLTGPGGTGKTRLAIEACAHESAEACFVDLSPVGDGAEVPSAVLGALGLRDSTMFSAHESRPDPVRRIVTALTDRRMLLLLDNCEHVIAEAAILVHRLLGDCPGLRVLATSREPLGITGEVLCPLAPLPLPAPGADVVEALSYPAVRLFADRATAVSPDFRFDGSSMDQVLRVCAELDGLPLAIELAAARLRSMPLEKLESGLEDRFRLLSRGSRTAAPRHRTLHAVVEWSWDLLDPVERELLRRLAVFTSAGAESVSVVCGLSPADADDVLTGLAEKSLIEHYDGRFRLLSTIRAFAAERLEEAGETEQVSRAHAEHILDLAETADPFLRRAEQLTWLARLIAEHSNLYSALRWAVHTDPRLALRLIGALSSYWRLRGVVGEIAPLATQLLDQLGEETPAGLEEEYVLAVLNAGTSTTDGRVHRAETIMRTLNWPLRRPYLLVAWSLFAGPPDPDAPETPLNRQLALTDDPWFRALSLFSLGYLRVFNAEISTAEPDFRAALEAFRSVGDRWGIAQVLDGLAHLADLQGDREQALTLTDEAITLMGQLGAAEELAELWGRRANRLRLRGDTAGARADYERSADLARRTGVAATLALAYRGLGELARERGEEAETARLCGLALEVCGTDWLSSGARSQILTTLGRVAEARGDLGDARALHREALDIALSRGLRSDLADATEGAAGLAVTEGDSARGARLLGIAVGLRGSAVATDPETARLHELLRTASNPEFDRGRAMSLDDAHTVLSSL